jgi:hypothetical protein
VRDSLIGYTPDGKPVVIWMKMNPWTGREEAFLEAGRVQIQLSHIAPGLEAALRASLRRA